MTNRPVILIVNGTNLNMLGVREPHMYGRASLADAEALARAWADKRGFDVEFFQSNAEAELLDRIHSAYGAAEGIVINPGGLTSTSISLLDALLAVGLPTVEVHVSHLHRREGFRQLSYVSHAAIAVISGAGIAGYGYAVDIIANTVLGAPLE